MSHQRKNMLHNLSHIQHLTITRDYMSNTLYLLKCTFIVFTIFFAFYARATVLEAKDAGIIKDEIAKLENGDMVLLDVKNVIFYSSDQVMFHEHKSFFKQKFAQIEKSRGVEEATRLKSIVLSSYKPVIVDQEISGIINRAQKSGIIVFALTSGNTSNYGTIPNRAALRIRTLKDIGIDFSKSTELDYIDLSKEMVLSKEKDRSKPIFQDGVIFAAKRPKGEILGKFLRLSKLKPGKIIFVDNQLENVLSVEATCKELGIDYTGIHFTKMYNKPSKPLDKKIAEKKFEILLAENRWIDDNEASLMVKK